MIRILNIEQAQSLRGTIPELALKRSLQFQGEGYLPEEHGHIVVIQEGDDLSLVEEVSPDGLILYDQDELPLYEFVEAFVENGQLVYEVVFLIDNSKTIAVIIPDKPWLSAEVRRDLKEATHGNTPKPF